MSDENNTSKLNNPLNDLINAAKEEKWDYVDGTILNLCNNPGIIEWASKSGVENEDGNIRDLAVSIFERSEHTPGPEEVTKLQQLMGTDNNPYVQFRSSFALFSHGIRTDEVINKLNEALKDPDVKEIAESYLKQLEEK